VSFDTDTSNQPSSGRVRYFALSCLIQIFVSFGHLIVPAGSMGSLLYKPKPAKLLGSVQQVFFFLQALYTAYMFKAFVFCCYYNQTGYTWQDGCCYARSSIGPAQQQEGLSLSSLSIFHRLDLSWYSDRERKKFINEIKSRKLGRHVNADGVTRTSLYVVPLLVPRRIYSYNKRPRNRNQ
jgi:hypothetical protein